MAVDTPSPGTSNSAAAELARRPRRRDFRRIDTTRARVRLDAFSAPYAGYSRGAGPDGRGR